MVIDDKRIRAYEINLCDLTLASKKMNCQTEIFESKIINVIHQDEQDTCIVLVEENGSYPFITSQWEKFIIKVDEYKYENLALLKE